MVSTRRRTNSVGASLKCARNKRVNFFYMDASALAKRYTIEPGSVLLDHLFANATPDRLYVFNLGIAEVASLLVRKKNSGLISITTLTQALADLRAQIVTPAVPHKTEAGN